MWFPLSKDDVERHLKDLGYRNVSEEQLSEFIKDLRRLIRYEEKQKRLRGLIQIRKDEISRRRKDEEGRATSPRSSCSSSSGHFSDEPDHQGRHEPELKHWRQKKPQQTEQESEFRQSKHQTRTVKRSISYW